MAKHADWLAHVELDGLVISEPVIEEHWPGGPSQVPAGVHSWFRRRAERYRVAKGLADPRKRVQGVREWIDFLLEDLLEMPKASWRKSHEIPDGLRVVVEEIDQELRPDRVLMRKDSPVLLVSIVDPDQGLDRKDRTEGRWKASPTTKLERLLYKTNQPLGLVTNGEDHRLVYARPGLNSGSITWTSRVLMEEKATLDAFYTLLGRDALLPTADDALTLADLCRLSEERQVEVANQLGEQVRGGLEQLIGAWDEANRETSGELLRDMTEDQLYEMGLVTMMRLVFLLYAEERDLLPHGEVLYDQGYGLTYLWHRLSQQYHEDASRLDQPRDAWDRFLATCRFIHSGCKHPDLSLIAYGGSLFDPRRYPVLEKAKFRVSNRTFYEVMRLLLFARQRKGGEPQRVGYWSINVEQIGYIYEGLLDHRCARAGDVPMVKLRGAGEESYPITELESRDRDALVKFISERTGRKEAALRSALDEEPDPRETTKLRRYPPAVVERVKPFTNAIQCGEVAPPGWYYLTTGTSRRASGAHYTPETLTERIVRVTLEPLVYRNVEDKPGLLVEPREVKTPTELLDLKVCDIAMGSGAFLVQAVRYLGDRLVEAWDRAVAQVQATGPAPVLSMPYADPMTDSEADRPIDPEKREEIKLWARRYVVERCIYGVDVNPLAVEMAKLSLWLTTLARDRPFTFLDHALKCGDSLVGVDREQLLSWSIDRSGRDEPIPPVFQTIVKAAVDRALDLRRQLQAIPVVEAADLERKAALLERADEAMKRVRAAGDLLLAPSFQEGNARQHADLRDQLLSKVTAATTDPRWNELRAEARRLLAHQRTFHWCFEFPEVFLLGNGGGFDAVVGNPPFAGKNTLVASYADGYIAWLKSLHAASHGNADLVAHFFRRAFSLIRNNGIFGLLATKTIRQGDTRKTGLRWICTHGGTIYAATRRMVWPGDAAVIVSSVHIRKGMGTPPYVLDGKQVDTITAYLFHHGGHDDPNVLLANSGKSFQGSAILGMGFTFDDRDKKGVATPLSEMRRLIERNPNNATRIFPFLGYAEVASHPRHEHHRFVIDFGDMDYQQASRWPDLLSILEQRVKPYREKGGKSAIAKKRADYWWRYGSPAKELYRAISGLERVLVTASQAATQYAFTFINGGSVYSSNLNVFAYDDYPTFGVLQSAIHEAWARFFGSTMKDDFSYTPTTCFETYPFPAEYRSDPRLETVGRAYHEARSDLMVRREEGLTKTYSRFHDAGCTDPDIQALRALHVEIDNAVRDAYGWPTLDLEHGWIKTVTIDEGRNRSTGKVETVEQVGWHFGISEQAELEILRLLLELNRKRHSHEIDRSPLVGRSRRGDDLKPGGQEGTGSVRFGAAKRKPPKAGLVGTDHGPLFQAGGHGSRDPEVEPPTSAVAETTAEPATTGGDPGAVILAYLRANAGWHSKDEILSGTGLPATRWLKTIGNLLDARSVEKQGEKRGTKYRAI